VWNSALKAGSDDCVILGASSTKQLKDTIVEIEKGPLEEWVLERLEKMWKTVEKDAPQDNDATYNKLIAAGGL
jgi:aflatoxin B1 aldehyde reductase